MTNRVSRLSFMFIGYLITINSESTSNCVTSLPAETMQRSSYARLHFTSRSASFLVEEHVYKKPEVDCL